MLNVGLRQYRTSITHIRQLTFSNQLHIKPEVHNIPVLHNIFFAFNS